MTGERLIVDAERALEGVIADTNEEPPIVRATIAWVLDRANTPDLRALVEATAPIRSYEDLAICALLGTDDAKLAEGCAWLRSTATRRGDHPAPVCLDAVAHLALSVVPAVREALGKWLIAVVAHDASPGWLAGTVRRLHGQPGETVAEVVVGMAARGCGEASPDEELSVLARLQQGTIPDDALQAAFALAALQWIRRKAPVAIPGRATADDVLRVLEGVTPALAEWTWEERGRKGSAEPVKWDVTSEYHVQNLLWLVLRPLFPDLKKEEYVPSSGHHQPRTDLLIPSLRLVIEVKYLDKTGRAAWRERTEELKADVTAYLLSPGSPADSLIVVLWDDTATTEQHETFRRGFDGVKGVVGAVVIARPGKMGKHHGGATVEASGDA